MRLWSIFRKQYRKHFKKTQSVPSFVAPKTNKTLKVLEDNFQNLKERLSFVLNNVGKQCD